GRYEIHELIGVGGMAYVYRAFDNKESRWVAIKILKEEFAENSEFLRRFRNESRAIAVLSHPNIVKIYDVSFGDRIQYIVMEFIDGITLKDYINKKGILSWKEAMYFTVQILRALQHAHEKGIIHRDVKPQNIILLQDGTIKVTDFGIARFSQSETQTMTDKALGSVHYIAPEQARGDFTSDKADIYSLGVMMYEMLTGQLPFEADNAVSVAIMQLQTEPQKPRLINPQIPVGLEEITMKAMEKKPSMRFQSAGEMLADIERFRQNPNMTFTYNYQQDLEATRQMDVLEDPRKSTTVYRDNYEYEEELVRSKKSARSSMVVTGIIAAVIIAALGVGIYFVFSFISNSTKEKTDEVLLPAFVGLNYETEIKGNAKYKDFTFKITEMVDEHQAPGIVLKQTPSDGIYVKIGKEVVLSVNKSTEKGELIPIPDLKGTNQTDAFNTLSEKGLTPKLESINDEETATGFVIKTDPKSGEEVPKGSVVTIFVSKGPSTVLVPVPDLEGLNLDAAKTLLKDSKLTIGEITYDEESEKEKDLVLSFSPKLGEKIKEGSSVKVVVSAGKKKEVTVSADFPLPAGVNMDLKIKIYKDGVLENEDTVNPYYVNSYSASFVGKEGSQELAVKLDDQDYIFATVNYDEQKVTITEVRPFV
ncbi:MAG: Stk1 family PASTA domain-containing Ser/Thr kinase, partial [Oscillospiraceae bacterium]